MADEGMGASSTKKRKPKSNPKRPIVKRNENKTEGNAIEPNTIGESNIALRYLKSVFFRRAPEMISALASLVAVGVAFVALDIAKNQLVSDNRAWVAPGRILFEKVPVGEKHWVVGALYQNTGNQPALRFNYAVASFPIPSAEIHNNVVLKNAIIRALDGKKCKEFEGRGEGSVVFPKSTGTLAIQIDPENVEKYANLTHFLVVAGYFTYETFGKPHRSCFCRFLDFTADRQNRENWRSSVCRIPEYAD